MPPKEFASRIGVSVKTLQRLDNIIVINNKSLSPGQELTEGLINIIHVFSCRSYGLRRYKKGLNINDKNTSNKNKT